MAVIIHMRCTKPGSLDETGIERVGKQRAHDTECLQLHVQPCQNLEQMRLQAH